MQSDKRNIAVGTFAVSMVVLVLMFSPGLLNFGQRKDITSSPTVSATAVMPIFTATTKPETEKTRTPTPVPRRSPSSSPSPPKAPNEFSSPGDAGHRSTATPTPTPHPKDDRLTLPNGTPSALKSVDDAKDEALRKLLVSKMNGVDGRYAIAVKNLGTGQLAMVNENDVFEAASLFKLSVMADAYNKREKQMLDFSEELTVTERAASFDLGVFKHSVGEPVTVTKAITDMITLSDNVCANVLLDRLGAWNVNQTMLSYGLEKTDISKDGLTTTASDMLRYFELLATGRIVNPRVSEEMIDVLQEQKINDRIPYLLPKGMPVAHKTGNLEGISHDAGIVYAPKGPYVFVALSQDLPDDLEGSRLIARLSKAVYLYFGNPDD